MKKIIAVILCLMMVLSMSACGGSEAAGYGSDGTSAQTGAAGDTPEPGEATLSADNSEATETTEATETPEAAMEAVPVPENVTVTNTTELSDKLETNYSGNAVYQDMVDYAALLESMGFTCREEFWNDGIYRVFATKDKVFIDIGLAHGMPDYRFQDMIAQGKEVSGSLSIYITVQK